MDAQCSENDKSNIKNEVAHQFAGLSVPQDR